MELVWWQVRRAWVAALAFQRPVWTAGSDLLNSLQVQGRRKEGRRREWGEIESPQLSSIMALFYIFIHLNISLKLLQALFLLKCLEVMSHLFLSFLFLFSPLHSTPLQEYWYNLVNCNGIRKSIRNRVEIRCVLKYMLGKKKKHKKKICSCLL